MLINSSQLINQRRGKAIGIFCLIVFSSFLLQCQHNAAQEGVLFDFESPRELAQLYWSCHTMYSLSDHYPSHGSHSLKLELYPFDKPDYPGLAPMIKNNNWSDFRELRFDIYNPAEQNVTVSLRIDDIKDYPEYEERYNNRFILEPGMNNIRVPLKTLITSGTARTLNLRKIYRLLLFMANPEKKVVLYVDYIRLIR
jgi:hypothetical protein